MKRTLHPMPEPDFTATLARARTATDALITQLWFWRVAAIVGWALLLWVSS